MLKSYRPYTYGTGGITRPDGTKLILSVPDRELKSSSNATLAKTITTMTTDPGGSPAVQSVVAYDETGQQTKVSFDYDQYGNVVNKREYGFQISGAWQVRRRTHITYVTTQAYLDAYMRSLPSILEVYDALANTNDNDDVLIGKSVLGYDSRSDVSDFFESLQGKVSVNTLHNLYGLLGSIFVVAREHGLCKKSPVRSKIHRPKTERKEKPTLTAAQIQAVLAGLPDERERLFAITIAVTGMRMGEALALRRMDFDSISCELSINHTVYRGRLKPPKTETSKRRLRLARSIATLIESHLKDSAFQATEDFIFCRPDGRPLNPSALRRHLYNAMDQAAIVRVPSQHGFHCLRHSAGTLVYLSSRDLRMVQDLLGHSDISTTSGLYVHPGNQVVQEASEILAREILENYAPTVPHESDLVN